MQFQISSRRENRQRDTWVIKIRVFRKVFSKQFCFIAWKDNTSGPLNRGGTADLPLPIAVLTIRQKFLGPSFSEVMEPFILLAYANLKASRTLLQQLLACLNFTLDLEDFFCWFKWKMWFLWTMAAAQAAENHGDEWGLTSYIWWGIYK